MPLRKSYSGTRFLHFSPNFLRESPPGACEPWTSSEVALIAGGEVRTSGGCTPARGRSGPDAGPRCAARGRRELDLRRREPDLGRRTPGLGRRRLDRGRRGPSPRAEQPGSRAEGSGSRAERSGSRAERPGSRAPWRVPRAGRPEPRAGRRVPRATRSAPRAARSALRAETCGLGARRPGPGAGRFGSRADGTRPRAGRPRQQANPETGTSEKASSCSISSGDEEQGCRGCLARRRLRDGCAFPRNHCRNHCRADPFGGAWTPPSVAHYTLHPAALLVERKRGKKMRKLCFAVVVACLAMGLPGAFEKQVEASPVDPWCLEDYYACVASGEDISVCMCYRDMCMGRDCQ